MRRNSFRRPRATRNGSSLAGLQRHGLAHQLLILFHVQLVVAVEIRGLKDAPHSLGAQIDAQGLQDGLPNPISDAFRVNFAHFFSRLGLFWTYFRHETHIKSSRILAAAHLQLVALDEAST